jgi:hypothetical protein
LERVATHFTSLCSLQRLTLNVDKPIDLSFLANVTTLDDLNINSSRSKLNISLTSLSTLTRLRTLSLTNIQITNVRSVWSALTQRLCSLSLVGCDESITDVFVEQITVLCGLTSLVLKPCSHMTDKSLHSLLLLTQLQNFEAKHMTKLSWTVTQSMRQFLRLGWQTSLRSLCLSNTVTNSSLFSFVADLHNLQSFKAGPVSKEIGTALTSDTLIPFFQSKKLTEFVVWPLVNIRCSDALTRLWNHCKNNYLWTDD